MFYKRFDEISANMSKIFRTKKSLLETAQQFDELSRSQDEENPFECGLVALAKFGEMQCYQKIDDKQKTVRTAVKAARLFVKSATFNYEISRNLRDTWSDPLADGLHCYRVAADALKSDGKPNLAVVLLLELGKTEYKFDLFHYAGNTYEEAVNISIDQKLSPPLLFDSTFNCIDCYSRADRLDLALLVVERVQTKMGQETIDQINASPLMKRQLVDLKIFKAQLLLSAFKHADCISYSNANLEEGVAQLFKELCDASKSNQIAVIDALINQAKSSNYFNEQQIALFERHLFLLSKSVETAYSELAQ
ncbi:hypothetical protein TRFO_31030 [Tritrichomonas foetus]|uniref:Uncharacterized protein n=1 Tax=Tritrichomonas foetus TaxID=1144522 RepID=A0A1J4JU57_9EUKA|nr:hypothetical protein TRFO_31030 [Tritrichomonas foetus]|eukprot:OHT02008.1 hypothetical protein TRFO_31030 [Tritrichomonas foetus]